MLIDDFNTACNNIDSSSLKVGCESMGVINFRTTEKGKLPPLSYISASRSHQEGSSIQLTVLLQGLVIIWVPEREGRYEAQQVPSGSWSDFIMC